MQQNVTKKNFNLQFTFNLHEEAVSEKINIFFLPSFQWPKLKGIFMKEAINNVYSVMSFSANLMPMWINLFNIFGD